MKTKIVAIAVLIVSAAVFTGCKKVNGKGAVETRVFEASGFDKVDLSNVGEVILVNDASQFVEIETHANIFDILKLEVKNNRLTISTKNGYSIGKTDKLIYYVHTPEVAEVNVSGSGSISGGNDITASVFKANISGSGEINITGIVATEVDANISGSGNIKLGGNTVSDKFTISGSGNIAGFDLTAETTEAKISGSGNIETRTTQSLNVTISGSGDVKYKGQPLINTNISGSGNLVNAN